VLRSYLGKFDLYFLVRLYYRDDQVILANVGVLRRQTRRYEDARRPPRPEGHLCPEPA
jgi:hypothetical protein